MAGFAELALVQGMSYFASAQEATAHNIANATTLGFKRRVPIAAQQDARFDSMLRAELPTARFSQATSMVAGDPNPTGEKRHFAVLTPDDYVALRDDEGLVYYSRTGEQRLDVEGRLVNEAGHVFLDDQGQPIVLGGGESSPSSWTIAENGAITNDDTQAPFGQRLGLYTDVDRSLEAFGEKRFVDTSRGVQGRERPRLPLAERVDTGGPPARITQGVLERSNVDVTSELVQMLTVQRGFEALSRSLGTLGRIRQAFVSGFQN